MLGDVGHRLAGHEVRCRLHGLGRTLGQRDIGLHRQDGIFRELDQRGGQAPVGERRGIDAVDEFPEFPEGRPRLLGSLVDEFTGGAVAPGELQPRETERHDQAGEALLGTVVQIALDPAALRIVGVQDAGPGPDKVADPFVLIGSVGTVALRQNTRGQSGTGGCVPGQRQICQGEQDGAAQHQHEGLRVRVRLEDRNLHLTVRGEAAQQRCGEQRQGQRQASRHQDELADRQRAVGHRVGQLPPRRRLGRPLPEPGARPAAGDRGVW